MRINGTVRLGCCQGIGRAIALRLIAVAPIRMGVVVMIVVLMGVSGVGKTTVGACLAAELGWIFVEADDFHPPTSIEKMRAGTPLTDHDRQPWLRALRGRIDEACQRGEDVVLACSALKTDYREYLEGGCPAEVRYVHLRASADLIRRRLEDRQGHFMNPALLESQFDALEPLESDVQVDATPPPEVITAEIRSRLGL